MAGVTNILGSLTTSQVKTLQKALEKQNYSVGSYGADGVAGKDTQAAIDKWYKDNGWSSWKGGGISQAAYDKIVNGTTTTNKSNNGNNNNGSSSKAGSVTSGNTASGTAVTTKAGDGTKGVNPDANTNNNTSGTAKQSADIGTTSAGVTTTAGNGTNAGKQELISTEAGDLLVDANGQTFNEYVRANYKYWSIGKDGLLCGSNISQQAADNLAKKASRDYTSGYTSTKGVQFTYNTPNPKSGTYKATTGWGTTDANVVIDPDSGQITGVEYRSGKPASFDKIDLGNNKVVYYDTDPLDGTSAWKIGTQTDYDNSVSYYNYIIQQKQAEEEGWYKEEDYDAAAAANVAQVQAATDLSVEEIKSQILEGLAQYGQDEAEQYLLKLKTQNNQALNNSAAGNTGGIGQKQYNDATASYDAQMLQIALEKEAFVTSCNDQINELRAQGRYEEANVLYEWAVKKLEDYAASYEWAAEYNQNQDQIDYTKLTTDREYAFNVANAMLEKGILTADVVEALGVSKEDAQAYADKINADADQSLAYAKQELKYLTAQTSNVKADTANIKADTAYTEAQTAQLGNDTTTNDNDGGSNPSDDTPAANPTTEPTKYYSDSGRYISVDSSGNIVEDTLQDGESVKDANGTVWYKYNGSLHNTPQTQDNGTKIDNTDTILNLYGQLSGDTKTKDLKVIKQAAQRKVDSYTSNMETYSNRIKQLESEYPSLLAKNRGTDASMASYNTVPASIRIQYESLTTKYNAANKDAGQWQKLVNLIG